MAVGMRVGLGMEGGHARRRVVVRADQDGREDVVPGQALSRRLNAFIVALGEDDALVEGARAGNDTFEEHCHLTDLSEGLSGMTNSARHKPSSGFLPQSRRAVASNRAHPVTARARTNRLARP